MPKLWICFMLLLLFTGCTAVTQDVPPAVPDSFACRVHIDMPDETIECDWTMTHGDSALVILSPETMRGMHVCLTNGDAQIELDGVAAALTDDACFARIDNAYRTLLSSPVPPVQTAQGWLYDDRASHGFALLQDAQSALPLRLSIPEYGITVTFFSANPTVTETQTQS